MAHPSRDDGPRVNQAIETTSVLLIDATGAKRGVVPTAEAIALAAEEGLDLVEVSAGDGIPVCKIINYGKYKFQAQKKAAEARKKQKTIEIKEIKVRPNIDTHDYDVKLRAVLRFLSEGDKVKVTMKLHGREMAHMELVFALFTRMKADIQEHAKIEVEPKLEGRQIMMVLAPKG